MTQAVCEVHKGKLTSILGSRTSASLAGSRKRTRRCGKASGELARTLSSPSSVDPTSRSMGDWENAAVVESPQLEQSVGLASSNEIPGLSEFM
mmetsp:Transcript_10428/g.23637  ORF Transcript_10428/g.23637 Transcript_10428/m.23637 type:complete len:93 (-) Transcript_10428:1577-1855(-)